MILVLESRKQITAKDLAERFEISVRTVYRDLETLSQAGIPVIAASGPGGGIALMEGFRLKLDTLDFNEISSIIKALVDQESIHQKDDVSQTMLLKVRRTLPKEIQDDFDRLINSIKIDSTNWMGKGIMPTPHNNILDNLKECILKKRKIVFDYKSYQRVTGGRIVHPLGLVKKSQVWYLVGFCEEHLEIRVFNTIRIQNMEVTSITFDIPEDFNINDYWEKTLIDFQRKSFIGKGRQVGNSKAGFPVAIQCSEKQKNLLGGFKILQEEGLGDRIIVTVDFISEHIATQQLILHLDSIIIIEPSSFRENIINKAKIILETQNY